MSHPHPEVVVLVAVGVIVLAAIIAAVVSECRVWRRARLRP